MSTRNRWAMGRRDQTDAVAKCCRATYYRHSAHTWFASAPWRIMMPEHAVTCYCGSELMYEEVNR